MHLVDLFQNLIEPALINSALLDPYHPHQFGKVLLLSDDHKGRGKMKSLTRGKIAYQRRVFG